MKVAQISKAGGDFELVERDIPEPTAGQVRVKVEACGICHSDTLVKEGLWPGLQYPRVPGHEVAGHVDALGSGVTDWKKGQRVGVGWHGGHEKTKFTQDCRSSSPARCPPGNSNRSFRGRDKGYRRCDECDSRGRVRALFENEKFPLAYERATFSRLSPAP